MLPVLLCVTLCIPDAALCPLLKYTCVCIVYCIFCTILWCYSVHVLDPCCWGSFLTLLWYVWLILRICGYAWYVATSAVVDMWEATPTSKHKLFGLVSMKPSLCLLACSHFVETQHTFSMQLGTQRVWDYIGGESMHHCPSQPVLPLAHTARHINHLHLYCRQLRTQTGAKQGGRQAGWSRWTGWHGKSFPH